MAVVISESYLSRPWTLGPQASRELIYDIQGTADEGDVFDALAATVPPVYGGLVLESVNADPVWVDAASNTGLWKGYAHYVQLENFNEYTFDTGGGTQKFTQSLQTIAAYAPAGLVAPDFQGAIGVSEDAVEGVDVVSPDFQFSETHRLSDAVVDGTYRRTLFALTGTMNDASFKGLDQGECLFLGASGSKRGDELWSITYRFAGSPNVTGLGLGAITGIDKFGWDYLWVRYADFEDSFAFALVKRPVAVYIERVYSFADFSTLNIGTT